MREALYEATSRGLQGEPKELPPVWLYDDRGSHLFEEITQLPEYYLTRCEDEILRAGSAEIARRTEARTLVELGSGTSTNTRLLLDALGGTLQRFAPLDVSEQTLRTSAKAIAAAYPGLTVEPIVGDFERDLGALPEGGPRVIAFLGSTIGNLYPERREKFLTALAASLAPADAFLLGVDLVKDVARLEAAYDDSRGVTEEFARNALTVVNRELGATFHQQRFAYEARWDPDHDWMDIGFRAREAQTVSVPALDLEVAFEVGEALRLEVSAKFRRDRVERELERSGLRVESWWTDGAKDFALALVRPR